MKPFYNLTNVDKAKVLHELFPDEMPAFLEFVKSVSRLIDEKHAELNATWKHQLFTFEFWVNLSKDAENKINQYNKKLHTSSRLFADQLFDGYAAFFAVHCLIEYIKKADCKNEKFVKAVDMFFE